MYSWQWMAVLNFHWYVAIMNLKNGSTLMCTCNDGLIKLTLRDTVSAEINVPGASFFEAWKTHQNPLALCTPPFENPPPKPIGFVYSSLWKITHQEPSVLCTPPLKNHSFWWALISGWAFISANAVCGCCSNEWVLSNRVTRYFCHRLGELRFSRSRFWPLPSSQGAHVSTLVPSLALRMVSGRGREWRTMAPYSPYSAIMVLRPQHFSVLRHFARRFWNHTYGTKKNLVCEEMQEGIRNFILLFFL